MSSGSITINSHTIDLSKQDKVLFPESGITKGKLVDYYRRIADIALPHYSGRPVTMQRFPDGIGAEGFFQKDAPDYFPDWIKRAELRKRDGTVKYVLVDKAATLVYLANQGCITLHPGLARYDRPDNPDRLVFDLDPSDEDFAKVQDAAMKLKSLLEELDLSGFVQTTGSRGLHVIVPLDRSANFDTAREFARAAVEKLVDRYADLLTVEQRRNKRGDRVFLDYLRNAYGQTSVGPYAVRAIEGAPVATPLRWDEVPASDLDPRRYTISNIFRRLAQIECPWANMARHGLSVDAARRRLSALG
jgi:bifunctional non-homologous end joining protein LigD